MQLGIQLIIIPFKAPVEEAEFAFYTTKQYGFCPIQKRGFNGAIEVLVGQRSLSLINQLIDQFYQFSSMYWKNVSQQNLPVTIKYPEMVAEIFPYFTHDKLPDHGKESLWFL